jgi:hypothetical protein
VNPIEEPEDVTAPPMDSDENESDDPDYGDPHYDSSDDEPARGDIARSDFTTLSISQKPSTAKTQGGASLGIQGNHSPQRPSARTGRKRSIDLAEEQDADESGVSSSKKRTKTTDSTHVSSPDSHLDDGFLVEKKFKLARTKYGKKAAGPAKTITSRDSTPNRKFQRLKSMSESVSPEQTMKLKILSPGSEASSPFKKARAPKVSKPTKEGESSSLSDIDSDDVLSDPPRPAYGRMSAQNLRKDRTQKPEKRTKRQTKRAGKNKPPDSSADEGISQRSAFKMPEGYNEFASANDLAGIDMPVYDDKETDKKANLGPDQAPCPMCDEPVDKQWLSEYSKGQRMSIARQAKFCHQHKKRSAREIWKMRGYPEVGWSQLETRIAAHHSYLESLINGASSHFGERLREKIKTGQNRTLFTTDEYPVPGYYGLRGMSTMTENIVDAFSRLLRERAPRDRLISARGHTGYVQSVLVPELGVRLIKEDMNITDDNEARAVMRESRALGIILNDERADPRVASRAQAQAEVASGGDSDGDEALRNNHKEGGTDDASDSEERVNLRIQRVDDSDSDASSLSSPGSHGPKASGKFGRLTGHDSGPGKLDLLGKAKEPTALGRDVVDDSDSDLSSLASLDKL